ncbi:MAG TPA: hypothetical protein VKF40_02040 [Burkholderiales bacterium]|nr:hypothetical protein [Burkholderiales bacterium]
MGAITGLAAMIPFVAYFAVGAAAELKARELGANDVLRKPLLARDLAASLARALHPH